MKPFIAIATFLLIVSVALVAFWSYDVWSDRKHTIKVETETPIFSGSGNELCGGSQLAVVQRGESLKVERIRYWKNCATVDVVLNDRRKGHVVLGDGQVSISPPLD